MSRIDEQIGIDEVMKLYQKHDMVDRYEDKRFSSFLGELSNILEIGIVNKYLKLIDEGIVLEVATGPGRLTKYLNIDNKKGIGVDSSRGMLEYAKKQCNDNWSFINASGFNVPIDSCQADVIVTFRLIRHFRRSEQIEFFKELNRILKPGGLLIFDMLNSKRSKTGKLLENIWMNLIIYYNIFKGKSNVEKVYDEESNIADIKADLLTAGFQLKNTHGIGNYYTAELFLDYLTAAPLLKYTRYIVNPILIPLFLKLEEKCCCDKKGNLEWVLVADKK